MNYKLKLTGKEYNYIIKSVKECLTKDSASPILNHIKIEVKDNILTAVALDGYKLSKVEIKLHFDNKDYEFLLMPAKIERKTNIVEIEIQEDTINIIQDEKPAISMPVQKGDYINYNQVLKIQKDSLGETTRVRVNAQYLSKILKDIKTDRHNTVELEISLKNKLAPIFIHNENKELDSKITKLLMSLRK